MNRTSYARAVFALVASAACHQPAQPIKKTTPPSDASSPLDARVPPPPPSAPSPLPPPSVEVKPASPPVSISFTTTKGPMLAHDFDGGCDMGRPGCPHFRVDVDGHVTSHVLAGTMSAQLTAEHVRELQKQIDDFDFAGHAWPAAARTCRAPVDGVDSTYTFRQSNGHTFLLSDCAVEVDKTKLPFSIVGNAEALATDAKASNPFTTTAGPMVAIDEHGGCDMHRAMCSHFRVETDGRIVAHESGTLVPRVSVDFARDLQAQIDAFDFAGHRWSPASHHCEAPVDGVDTSYTFRQSNGHTFVLSDCGVDVVTAQPPFSIAVNAKLHAAAPK